MPPKAVWVVATLLPVVLCAVAQDVTLQENRHALTMHPLVMETLMFACSGRDVEWKCFPKQTEYNTKCRRYAKSLASSQDQAAALQHCLLAFTPSRRSDAEIRNHPDDGPIYLKYLKEYMEANVVVQEEKTHEHPHEHPPANTTQQPPANTTQQPPNSEKHGSEPKKSVLNWSSACAMCVIVFVLAVVVWCVVSWKQKEFANRLAESQSAKDKLDSQIADLISQLETDKTAGETPGCYTRLCELHKDKLVQLCGRLELSTEMINKVAKTPTWKHERRCAYILGECGKSETQIKAVLDEYFTTRKSSTSPLIVPSQLPNISEGGGWGGRSGLHARNNNTPDPKKTDDTAPATGLPAVEPMLAGSPQASLYAPQHMNSQPLNFFQGGSVFAQHAFGGQNVNGANPGLHFFNIPPRANGFGQFGQSQHLAPHIPAPRTTLNGVQSQDLAPSSHIPALGITTNGVQSQDLAPLIQIPAPESVPSQDQALSEHTLGRRKRPADGPNKAVSGQSNYPKRRRFPSGPMQ